MNIEPSNVQKNNHLKPAIIPPSKSKFPCAAHPKTIKNGIHLLQVVAGGKAPWTRIKEVAPSKYQGSY